MFLSMLIFYCVGTVSESKSAYCCVRLRDYSSHSNHQTSKWWWWFLCNTSVTLFQLVILISTFTIFTLLSFDHNPDAVKSGYIFQLYGRTLWNVCQATNIKWRKAFSCFINQDYSRQLCITLFAFIPTIIHSSIVFLLWEWEGNVMQELATAYQYLLCWSLTNIHCKWYDW